MADVKKCPYCYSLIGTWLNDPVLLFNGSKYDWIDETELDAIIDVTQRKYKGCYQILLAALKEIQDNRKQLELENLPEVQRTTFSSINATGNFQITGQHIKELRDSTEKLLTSAGLTLTDFLNYDMQGNHILHPKGNFHDWTDPIETAKDLSNFQLKAIHIEELRHYLDISADLYIRFMATTFTRYTATKKIENSDANLASLTVTPPGFFSILYSYAFDQRYTYYCSSTYLVVSDDSGIKENINLGSIGNLTAVDDTYIYVLRTCGGLGSGSVGKLWKIKKGDYLSDPVVPAVIESTKEWASTSDAISGIQLDSNYIYIHHAQNVVSFGEKDIFFVWGFEYVDIFARACEIEVLNKSDLTPHHTWYMQPHYARYYYPSQPAILTLIFAYPYNPLVETPRTRLDFARNKDYFYMILKKQTYTFDEEEVTYTKTAEIYGIYKTSSIGVAGVDIWSLVATLDSSKPHSHLVAGNTKLHSAIGTNLAPSDPKKHRIYDLDGTLLLDSHSYTYNSVSYDIHALYSFFNKKQYLLNF